MTSTEGCGRRVGEGLGGLRRLGARGLWGSRKQVQGLGRWSSSPACELTVPALGCSDPETLTLIGPQSRAQCRLIGSLQAAPTSLLQ